MSTLRREALSRGQGRGGRKEVERRDRTRTAGARRRAKGFNGADRCRPAARGEDKVQGGRYHSDWRA